MNKLAKEPEKSGEALKAEWLKNAEQEAWTQTAGLVCARTMSAAGVVLLQKQLDLLLSAHFAREAEKQTR